MAYNGATRFCSKCQRTMDEKNFYQSKNLEKYPDGKIDVCKKCLTLHVDNMNPDSYLWILQELDVPYLPDEWYKLLETWGKDPSKLNGTTILGKYLSKMKLRQFKDHRWVDSQALQEIADAKVEAAMKRQNFDSAEIAKVLAARAVTIPQGELEIPNYPPPQAETAHIEELYGNDVEDDDFDDELTDEDKTYLRLKWGKTYKPSEWVQLEQMYEEMMQSYDIQSPAHKDTLKLLCKTSLKANQLIDIGDKH